MTIHGRPSARDWLTGSVLGIGLGTIILGIGGRVAMRGIAVLSGATPGFSAGGTTTVVLLGALSGLVGALVFLGLRLVLPKRPVPAGMAYWMFLTLVSLRGLRPIDAERLLLFMPLVVIYGVVLQVGWSRLALRGRGREALRPDGGIAQHSLGAPHTGSPSRRISP